jgi:thymidylate synthase
MRYDSFHDAFHATIKDIISYGERVQTSSARSIATNFTHTERFSKELTGYSFTITNPRNRILPCRGDLRYNIANFFWTIAENGNPEHIIHYNPRGKVFLEDNELKCDIPSRLRNNIGGSQIKDAIKLLKEDMNTRRAFVTIGRPEDIHEDNLDFPCPASIHFLIRNNKLNCIVNMRSQSAYGVMPYDVFLFTMIEEAVALEVGVELGYYTHISNSLHIYEDELEKVQQLKDIERKVEPMDEMALPTPIFNKTILEAETLIRETGSFESTDFDYWDNILSSLL